MNVVFAGTWSHLQQPDYRIFQSIFSTAASSTETWMCCINFNIAFYSFMNVNISQTNPFTFVQDGLSRVMWRCTSHEDIKGVEVQLHLFLTSATEGGECPTSRRGRFPPPHPGKNPHKHCTRSPFVTLLSRSAQSGRWSSFGKRVWFTESRRILIISFFICCFIYSIYSWYKIMEYYIQ